MMYAKILAKGDVTTTYAAERDIALNETLLRDGFLPFEREEEPEDTTGMQLYYRAEADKIVGYWGREPLEKLRVHKIAEIMAYDSSSAVNSFTIDGDEIWIPLATRLGLVNQASSRDAVYEMQGVAEEERIMVIRNPDTGDAYTKTVSEVLMAMAMLEVYAGDCYNATADHVAAVQQIESEEELDAYDFTIGYPDKINL